MDHSFVIIHLWCVVVSMFARIHSNSVVFQFQFIRLIFITALQLRERLRVQCSLVFIGFTLLSLAIWAQIFGAIEMPGQVRPPAPRHQSSCIYTESFQFDVIDGLLRLVSGVSYSENGERNAHLFGCASLCAARTNLFVRCLKTQPSPPNDRYACAHAVSSKTDKRRRRAASMNETIALHRCGHARI